MIGASLLLLAFGLDGRIGLVDAIILFVLLVLYTVFLVIQSRRETRSTEKEYETELEPKSQWDAHWAVQLVLIGVGLVFLVLGSNWLVEAATNFAKAMGVSDLVIGLTIVAAGTSMPEVATSIMAAVRKQRDIAVGNVIGSNTFNILGCLGLSGMVAPDGLGMAPALMAFDIWVMLAVALACLPVFMTGREIARWEGLVFLVYYAAYTTYLILAAQAHDSLATFNATMMGFVVPITVITLVVVLIKPRPATSS